MMYDVAIVGVGCAGYTAAIYTSRYKLSTIMIGAEEGGMGMTAAEVGNWPGIQDIKGPDLMKSFKDHAVSLGAEHRIGRVQEIVKTSEGFNLTVGKDTIQARSIILATGSAKRHLGIPGEEEFSGKGVTYCATCDAFFYRGKDVAVIGGGDSAVEGAAIAAKVARKVYLIHRRDDFRAEPYWVDKVKASPNVEFVLNTNVLQVLGENVVTGVKLDKPYNGSDTILLNGVFIEVGSIPSVELATKLGASLDDRGFIAVDKAMATTVPGLFAAGDVTNGSNHFAQFTTAAGEATVAANSVFSYLHAGK